jgi:ferritin-like metal-binding protein YciE
MQGMEGLVEEGEEMIKEDELEDEARDAGLISAAQRVEHYEIAAYGCVRTYANLLGEGDAVELLDQTPQGRKGNRSEISEPRKSASRPKSTNAAIRKAKGKQPQPDHSR